ncbi:hypothetical protein J3459_017676 [Metarhizium acridum]|nr:hypothetical protein J3459_017676 [Metarhizium acridum]
MRNPEPEPEQAQKVSCFRRPVNMRTSYWLNGYFRLLTPLGLGHKPNKSILSTTFKPLSELKNPALSNLANSEGQEGFQFGASHSDISMHGVGKRKHKHNRQQQKPSHGFGPV